MRFRFSSSWEHFNLSYRSLLVRHNGSQCPERGYMVELGVNEGEQTVILLSNFLACSISRLVRSKSSGDEVPVRKQVRSRRAAFSPELV